MICDGVRLSGECNPYNSQPATTKSNYQIEKLGKGTAVRFPL